VNPAAKPPKYCKEAHIQQLEARVQELDILNDELTDLYNKHMKSWAEREKSHLARIRDLEFQLGMVRW
jgi:hypothetical protein